MHQLTKIIQQVLAGGLLWLSVATALASPVYQPPGANLTYGDVTHGQRVQSASSNPAAAAADLARGTAKTTRGTVLSDAAGLEYGNVQNLFDFYDKVTGAYDPSDPGDGGDAPGQDPGDKPDGGIDLGDIWDSLDPDFQATLKAFGIVQPIEFDEDAARAALEDWFNQLPINRPEQFPLTEQVLLTIEPATNAVRFAIDNDSSMLSKATQTTELNLGYSRHAWSNSAGSLFLGAEARLYFMRLSRLSVRFGDITNSEELFDAIRHSDFRNDERLGVDIGALWVADNYQLGVQITNVNEPKFTFPEIDLNPYQDEGIIGFLQRDQSYTMDRQLKLEASLFTSDRRWSAHLGLDADSATDPMGDDYQWLTLSAGFTTDSWWLPGVRIGYRENLAGTEMKYIGVALTAFKIVNFDIASALDTVKFDGTTLPQGLMLSIGFQIAW